MTLPLERARTCHAWEVRKGSPGSVHPRVTLLESHQQSQQRMAQGLSATHMLDLRSHTRAARRYRRFITLIILTFVVRMHRYSIASRDRAAAVMDSAGCVLDMWRAALCAEEGAERMEVDIDVQAAHTTQRGSGALNRLTGLSVVHRRHYVEATASAGPDESLGCIAGNRGACIAPGAAAACCCGCGCCVLATAAAAACAWLSSSAGLTNGRCGSISCVRCSCGRTFFGRPRLFGGAASAGRGCGPPAAGSPLAVDAGAASSRAFLFLTLGFGGPGEESMEDGLQCDRMRIGTRGDEVRGD